jgi:hypothetical protein
LAVGMDQGGMDGVLTGQLVDGTVRLQRRQGNLRLERRRVLLPCLVFRKQE